MDNIGFLFPRSSSTLLGSQSPIAESEESDDNEIAQVENGHDEVMQKKDEQLISYDDYVAGFTPDEFESDVKGQIWLSNPATRSMLCYHKPKRAASQSWKDILVESVPHANSMFETQHKTGTNFLDQPYDSSVFSKDIGTVLQKRPPHPPSLRSHLSSRY